MLCEDVFKFFLITFYGVNMEHVLNSKILSKMKEL